MARKKSRVTKKKKKPVARKKMTKKSVKKIKKKAGARRNKQTTKLSAVPKGYISITPYLIINNARDAIDFYKRVFGAKEGMLLEQPNGRIVHAELKIGDAKIMLADEFPEMGARSPEAFGGSAVGIHVYVKDVDEVVDRAVSAGATLMRPVENMFYGDRSGTLVDPYGHKWHVSTHIENVPLARIKKLSAEMFSRHHSAMEE